MTLDEAKEIIKNAKPIVLPKSGNTVSINENKRMTSFQDFFNNGINRRKKGTRSHQESGETKTS